MTKRNKHYAETAVTIQLIDILQFAPFLIGNVIKYLVRYGHKDGKNQEDLKKAKDYLTWLQQQADDSGDTREDNCKFLDRYGPLLVKFYPFSKIDTCHRCYLGAFMDTAKDFIKKHLGDTNDH